ncbi:MarR family winged helix-turn-helix transcriptional regulator [Jatrophihabitans sp. YIM 134969]
MSARSDRTPFDPVAEAEWLTPEQVEQWLAVARLTVELPWALESQLQRDARISWPEYMTMAMLSEAPAHTMRMSELAEVTNASLSRLSHLVTRLEGRGWVRRETDPRDGRATIAILTEDGYAKVVATAPAHAANVRRLVVDALSPAQLRSMAASSNRIVERVKGERARPSA